MQQGRKLQLFARKSSSIVIAPQPGRQTFAITHGEQRQQRAPVIRLLRIWYRVKAGIFTGAIEFIFVLTIKMEIAGELFRRRGNLHLAVVDM